MDVGPRNATHHHNTSTITSISGISITSSTVGEEFGPFMPSEMPATYDKLFVRHIDDVSGGAVGGGGEPPTPGAGSYDFMHGSSGLDAIFHSRMPLSFTHLLLRLKLLPCV
jgi:hypothetical protein